MEKELHQGHRERFRLKFKLGSHLEDHEILELLLFYAIPRQNTNEIAHRLMNKFGNFRRVFDADLEQLQKVDGIGENSAIFLRAISEAIARYSQASHFITHPLSSRAELSEYLCSLFIGESKEHVALVLLTSSGRILHTELFAGEFSGMSEFSIKKITALAMQQNAASVVLAHNHPDGIATPSAQDILATRKIRDLLEQLGIILIDHFVVSDQTCVPILHNDMSFTSAKKKAIEKRSSK